MSDITDKVRGIIGESTSSIPVFILAVVVIFLFFYIQISRLESELVSTKVRLKILETIIFQRMD